MACVTHRKKGKSTLICCQRENIRTFTTARKRSLGQGNVFTPVCHSVHRGKGVCLTPPHPECRPGGEVGQTTQADSPLNADSSPLDANSWMQTPLDADPLDADPPDADPRMQTPQMQTPLDADPPDADGTHPTGMHSCLLFHIVNKKSRKHIHVMSIRLRSIFAVLFEVNKYRKCSFLLL